MGYRCFASSAHPTTRAAEVVLFVALFGLHITPISCDKLGERRFRCPKIIL